MNSKNILQKIADGRIKNPDGYKHMIKKQIENNSFNGVNSYHHGLIQKEKTEILLLLSPAFSQKTENDEIIILNKLLYDDTNLIVANYKSISSDFQKNFAVVPQLLTDILSPKIYTKTTQDYIANYIVNYKKQQKQNEVKDE